MFNLLISSNPESWDSSPWEIERGRAVVEYTANEISERYKFFDEKAIRELKSFPSLFVIENEERESRIGNITNIRVRQSTVVIDFVFDPILPPLRIGAIEDLRTDIDLGKWELSRTHWAVKDEPLFDILVGSPVALLRLYFQLCYMMLVVHAVDCLESLLFLCMI